VFPLVAPRRAAALAALVAGPIFLLMVVSLTLVVLDFMHSLGWRFTGGDDVPWPSGLALGRYGAVQIVNFGLAGALLLVFAGGFRHEFKRRRSGRIATVLLNTLAFAVFGLASATDRATAAGNEPDTWHGWLHVAAFAVTVAGSVVAPLGVAIALRGNERWRGFRALSVGTALVVLALFVLPFGDPAFAAFLVVLFGWFAALGFRLHRLSG
jgi:hypothetical protein